MSDTLAPLPIEAPVWQMNDHRHDTPVGEYGNKQWIYRFTNGYGASVTQGRHTYGGPEGLYELAVIRFEGDDWELTYETPVTEDVLGRLSIEAVAAALADIAALEKTDA